MSKNRKLASPVSIACVLKFADDVCRAIDFADFPRTKLPYSCFNKPNGKEAVAARQHMDTTLMLAQDALGMVAVNFCNMRYHVSDWRDFQSVSESMNEVGFLAHNLGADGMTIYSWLGLGQPAERADLLHWRARAACDGMLKTRSELLEAITVWRTAYGARARNHAPSSKRMVMVPNDLRPHYCIYRMGYDLLRTHGTMRQCSPLLDADTVVAIDELLRPVFSEYVQTRAMITGWEAFERWEHVQGTVLTMQQQLTQATRLIERLDIAEARGVLTALRNQVPTLTTRRTEAVSLFAYKRLGMPAWQEKNREIARKYDVAT